MTINNKNDCIQCLTTGFTGTSRWRTGRDIAYPGDARNLRAATRLTILADEASDLTDEEWRRLIPHYSWASKTWIEAISRSMREIGFKRHPESLSDFVHDLVSILEPQQVAA